MSRMKDLAIDAMNAERDAAPRVVLTDPRPLPASAACPKCGAPADRRVTYPPFGADPKTLCGVCGYQFPGETA